jgi:outer membrane immunogenic protein
MGALMRRNLLASTALTTSTTLIAGAAWAADMPVKAPPPPAVAPFSWSGCYAGGNAGWASTSIDQSAVVPAANAFLDSIAYDSSGREHGFIGGGQAGCNWQLDPKWVIGLEGDVDYVKPTRSVQFGGEDTVHGSQTTSLHWLATIRGRFGYTWDRWFLYATGGLALGRVQSSVTASDPPGFYSGSYSATRAGSTEGGGVEYAFTDRLSGKMEYLHFDLSNASYTVFPIAAFRPVTWTASAKVSGDIVRVGLNFKLTP